VYRVTVKLEVMVVVVVAVAGLARTPAANPTSSDAVAATTSRAKARTARSRVVPEYERCPRPGPYSFLSEAPCRRFARASRCFSQEALLVGWLR
jgi:hypothetical protein